MKTTDIVRERTPEEKESFVEGFNTCVSGMKSDLTLGRSLEEAIEHAESIARLLDPTTAEGEISG